MRRLGQLRAVSNRNRSSAGFSEYLERHNVFELMSDLISQILLAQPQDPIRFVHEATAKLIAMNGSNLHDDEGGNESEEADQGKDHQQLTLRMRLECMSRNGKVERAYFVRKCPSSAVSGLRIQAWREEAMDEICKIIEKAFIDPIHCRPVECPQDEERSVEEESSNSWILDEQFRSKLQDLHDRMRGGLQKAEAKSKMFELSMQTGLSSEVFSGLYEVDFSNYHEAIRREWEITRKEWSIVNDTSIVRVLARSLPGGSPDAPLSFFHRATEAERKSVWSKQISLLASSDVRREQHKQVQRMVERDFSSGNSKFEIFTNEADVRVATFGRLEEFYKGLIDKIGLPSPQLMRGMESEHCLRGDSFDEFEPGNYNTRTTPCKEWQAVTDESTRKSLSVHPRRVRSMEDLLKEEIVQRANLLPEEILALQLYTGAILCVLRGIRIFRSRI
mmetsp:Transcript_11739/g.26945  ORF Transcript_11739/g.26945 Transcript_11739/m.26945 type:complete len:447 (-) Transcript_11739:3452-4792(-)